MIQFYGLVLIVSLIIAYFGRYRRFGFWGYLFASLLLTPLVGLLLLIASDKQVPEKTG